MDDEVRKKIEEIISGMQCPKDFKCADSGFEVLCKARDIGLDNYLDCLEKNPLQCPFVIPFGRAYLCHCPLRVFLAKNLKKL